MPNQRNRMVRKVSFTLVMVFTTVFFLILFQRRNPRQEISRTLIVDAIQSVQNAYTNLAVPIEKDLAGIRRWGESGLLDIFAQGLPA